MEVARVEDVEPLSHRNLQVTCDAIMAEVIRQDALARSGRFGGTHILPSGPDHARLAVLVEEVGEVSRELNEQLMHGGDDAPAAIRKERLLRELIQVGACAAAWATALEGHGA